MPNIFRVNIGYKKLFNSYYRLFSALDIIDLIL
jgi:hypothetical protein